MTNKKESAHLFFQEGSSDKVYNVFLDDVQTGWSVTFSYGRRGNALQHGAKTQEPTDYAKAKKIYDKLIAEKTGKGYQLETNNKFDEDEEALTGERAGERMNGDDNIPVINNQVILQSTKDTGFRPQLLNETTEETLEKYITDPNYCMQEKHDGRRRGLIKNELEVLATNKKGKAVIASNTITNALAHLFNDVQLDAEDMGEEAKVFDVLFLNRDLKKESYRVRYEHLQKLLQENKILRIVRTAWTEKEKRAMLKHLRAENAEGVVFKRIDAPYKAGRPASGGDQLKFKFKSTASCIVKSISPKKRSVALRVYDGTNLVDIGNVTVYPNQEIPKAGSIVEVQYLYYFRNGSLFQPVLLGKGNVERDDVDAEECTIGKLKLKKEEVEQE